MTNIQKLFFEGEYRAVVRYNNENDSPETLYDLIYLGYSYMYLHRYTDALNTFMRATEASPVNAEAHLGVGLAYRRLGFFEKSGEELTKATTLAPDFVMAYVELATLYREAGQEKLETETLEIVSQLAPESFNLILELGHTAYNQNQYLKAIDFYRNALSQNQDSADANYSLALTYIALKKMRLALPCVEKAICLRPDWVDAHYTLSLIHIRSRQYRKGIEALKTVIDINPDFRAAYIGLVGLSIICGNWHEAWRLFQLVKDMPIDDTT